MDWCAEQFAGKAGRIADGCRAGDKARFGAVELQYPAQAAQHVGHVGTKHAAVDMQFIDHHKGEIFE